MASNKHEIVRFDHTHTHGHSTVIYIDRCDQVSELSVINFRLCNVILLHDMAFKTCANNSCTYVVPWASEGIKQWSGKRINNEVGVDEGGGGGCERGYTEPPPALLGDMGECCKLPHRRSFASCALFRPKIMARNCDCIHFKKMLIPKIHKNDRIGYK